MIHRRITIAFAFLALASVASALLTLTGCSDSPSPGELDITMPPLSVPTVRYAPRTDLLAIAIPEGSPTHWYATGFPPLRSVRLFPNTPDRDLAAELRKQLGKNILDPTDTSLLTPRQADRISRLMDTHFGTPAAPTVRMPDWDTTVASAIVRFEPDQSMGASLKSAKDRLRSFKWDLWKADWDAAAAAKEELKLDDATLVRGSAVYRRWCMQCHGPSGAGDSAHAVVDGPMPRDYRQGVFKYITAFPPSNVRKKGLGAAGKARRADL
jgi:hypothetical protein